MASEKNPNDTEMRSVALALTLAAPAYLYLDALAPKGTRLKEILAATPYQTCRHGRHDKGIWFG